MDAPVLIADLDALRMLNEVIANWFRNELSVLQARQVSTHVSGP